MLDARPCLHFCTAISFLFFLFCTPVIFFCRHHPHTQSTSFWVEMAAHPTPTPKKVASDLVARQTIRDKCEFVRLSIREYEGNSLQLHQFLGLLPQHIFGLDSSRSNWFAEACGKQDIEALCQLLSPNSDLFAHLLKSVDDNRKVAVPVSLLPPSVQKGIKANDPTIASPFFQSKIPSHVQGAAISTIPLNLFEFYMVSFAFLATRGIQARGKAQPDDRARMSTYLPRFSAEPEKAAGLSPLPA
jgi:hypothetical protein